MDDLEKAKYVNAIIATLRLANKNGLLFEVVNEWIPDKDVEEKYTALLNACYEWDVF